MENERCIKRYIRHKDSVNSVCFSSDEKKALSGSKDKTIKLWDIDTGQCIRTFNGHMDDVSSVCFSPDGKSALSGSSDKTLKLWNIISKPHYEMAQSKIITTEKEIYYTELFNSLVAEYILYCLSTSIKLIFLLFRF